MDRQWSTVGFKRSGIFSVRRDGILSIRKKTHCASNISSARNSI